MALKVTQDKDEKILEALENRGVAVKQGGKFSLKKAEAPKKEKASKKKEESQDEE